MHRLARFTITLILLLLGLTVTGVLSAQSSVYIVQPGDTLFSIAQRYRLDIDCLVVGDLEPLLRIDADFVGWRPGSVWGRTRRHRLGGGTWLLKTGTQTDVWDSLSPAGVVKARSEGWRGSDQAWISHKLSGKVPIWPQGAGIYQAQDIKPHSYRIKPPGARIVHFNGERKPWQFVNQIEWITEAYH